MKQPDYGVKTTSRPASCRRRALRLEAPANLTVTLSDPNINASVVDIGQGGLGLRASRPIKKGDTCDLTLRLDSQAVTCAARSAHCKRRDDGQWLVGMTFVRDHRIELIERFVDAMTGNLIQFS